MFVFLPLETRHIVQPEVLGSIKAQIGVGDIIIVECKADGEYHSKGNHSPLRIKGEKASRLLCRDKAFNSGEEYVVIQDRGYFNTCADNYSSMLYYMKTHPLQGAVSLVWPRGNEPTHIDVGCCMWRVSVLAKITMDSWVKGCACYPICEEVRYLGADIGYLPGLIRVTKL